jgi:hypothetical protein
VRLAGHVEPSKVQIHNYSERFLLTQTVN